MPPSDAPRRLGVVVAGCTDVGRVRDRNEDAYLIASLADSVAITNGVTEVATISAPACLIVADGVGGAASGDLASLLAQETIFGQLRRKYTEGALITLPDTARAMLKAVAVTNHAVYTYATNHPEHHGMATTITLALTYDDVVLVAQIGDSRAYLVREGIARQLTKDQSLVQQLVDAGEITEFEAARSSHRNIILQALGSEPDVVPDLYCVTVQPGDVLLLCSDGLSNYLTPPDIAILTSGPSDMAAVCANLITCASARGGDDNITVVVGQFEQITTDVTTDVAFTASETRLGSTSPTLVDRVRRWLR